MNFGNFIEATEARTEELEERKDLMDSVVEALQNQDIKAAFEAAQGVE
ncbi:MAG: hypothetical protein IH795_06715 [Bacteroidetes bacterium]|nr:hypothetical protein [Bacteroidota bacterium]